MTDEIIPSPSLVELKGQTVRDAWTCWNYLQSLPTQYSLQGEDYLLREVYNGDGYETQIIVTQTQDTGAYNISFPYRIKNTTYQTHAVNLSANGTFLSAMLYVNDQIFTFRFNKTQLLTIDNNSDNRSSGIPLDEREQTFALRNLLQCLLY